MAKKQLFFAHLLPSVMSNVSNKKEEGWQLSQADSPLGKCNGVWLS